MENFSPSGTQLTPKNPEGLAANPIGPAAGIRGTGSHRGARLSLLSVCTGTFYPPVTAHWRLRTPGCIPAFLGPPAQAWLGLVCKKVAALAGVDDAEPALSHRDELPSSSS